MLHVGQVVAIGLGLGVEGLGMKDLPNAKPETLNTQPHLLSWLLLAALRSRKK